MRPSCGHLCGSFVTLQTHYTTKRDVFCTRTDPKSKREAGLKRKYGLMVKLLGIISLLADFLKKMLSLFYYVTPLCTHMYFWVPGVSITNIQVNKSSFAFLMLAWTQKDLVLSVSQNQQLFPEFFQSKKHVYSSWFNSQMWLELKDRKLINHKCFLLSFLNDKARGRMMELWFDIWDLWRVYFSFCFPVDGCVLFKIIE